ncbi:maleylpyruvate isomerase N-terminal domain-containing protein [Rhizobium sp. P28RR-XV]|uniref:maleylpyruvate isomerase N-terminal domain-containing protein n=1 Tax=Rhizobium sp. P28RR-XV TaxID=2726737 RepID=UPI0014579657|nr:maleylpyruvate isomerase N-terminal domain-containing protein [Rhizobium sp. P28RR-XV]NLR88190.1 maleylpyruvate isomerase family mycothiol-dependent enzyme [Rhizobium sp. P28RR-XV]
MMSYSEAEERARLKERLGAGARYDSDAAPGQALLMARRGTAYFARRLNELSDADLDGPSLVEGWSRRHVVAHVGYNARRLARIAGAARRGMRNELPPEADGPPETVEFGSTLPAHALRYLFKHSEVHLNVEWRDLPAQGWPLSIEIMEGVAIPAATTPLMRAREVWLQAVNLNNGASIAEVPAILAEQLRRDVPKGPKANFLDVPPTGAKLT